MDDKYQIRLSKVTGLLIATHRSTRTYVGTKEELAAVYKNVLRHNLLFGGLGLSIVPDIIIMYANRKAFRALRNL